MGSTEIENLKIKGITQIHLHHFIFREGPNINSKVLNRIRYGRELIITGGPLIKHDLTFIFSTHFKQNAIILFTKHIL